MLIVTNNNQHYINTFSTTQEQVSCLNFESFRIFVIKSSNFQDRKTGTPNRRLSLNHISPNAGTIVYRPSPTQSPAGNEFNTTLVGSNNISLNKVRKKCFVCSTYQHNLLKISMSHYRRVNGLRIPFNMAPRQTYAARKRRRKRRRA